MANKTLTIMVDVLVPEDTPEDRVKGVIDDALLDVHYAQREDPTIDGFMDWEWGEVEIAH